MFERILVPLDGSTRAEAILGQVDRILRRRDSEVLFFRVLERAPVGDLEVQASLLRREREEAQTYIHNLTRRYAEKGMKVNGRIEEGSAAKLILKTADLEGSTLIAMSSHGRTGLGRWLLGSVAEAVARESKVPLLLLRSSRGESGEKPSPAKAEEKPFRKILVPVDGSSSSMEVVAPATKLAQLYGSDLVVLHVEMPIVLPGTEIGALPLPLPTPSEQDPATAKAAERFRQAGLGVTTLTVLGEPAGRILDESEGAGVDLIAMSSHGRSGVRRWFLGSVAERVLRHSTAPLLLVRAEASQGKKKNARGSTPKAVHAS